MRKKRFKELKANLEEARNITRNRQRILLEEAESLLRQCENALKGYVVMLAWNEHDLSLHIGMLVTDVINLRNKINNYKMNEEGGGK